MNICVNIHFQEFALRLANELEIDVNEKQYADEDNLLTSGIAVKLSKGEDVDSEMRLIKPLNVTGQSAEDGLAGTVKPRLEQAGADCEKIEKSLER